MEISELSTGAPLSPQAAAVLRAAVRRIIPADDYPDGWAAGVGDYLARLWRRQPGLAELYEGGLAALDAEARACHGQAFPDLDAAEQDAILARMEAGEAQAAGPVDSARFFARLVDQAMEGYYADPGNGGNRDGISWKMVGFEVRG